jgi:hypothetical protein
MNKRDIRIELESMARELMAWQEHLEPVSEALTQLFRDQIVYLSNRKPSDFDSEGILRMMGKVRGMVAAAAVLMNEWRHHNEGPDPGMTV